MKRRIALGAAVLITLAVFAFSMLPEKQKARTTGLRLYPIDISGHVVFVNPHRIAHWVAFGVVTMAFCAAVRTLRARVMIAIAVLGLAWFIEWAEAFVYHSGFERYDVRDDALGIAAGLILIEVAAAIWSERAALITRRTVRENAQRRECRRNSSRS